MTTRRQLLTAGVATLAVGGLGLVYRTTTQGVFGVERGSAYALWETWDRGVGLEPVVAAGVLSSNPHDIQPWRFRVEARDPGLDGAAREGVVDVFRDPDRTVGSLDPFLREVHAGLGCAVENIAVMARARGYEPTVTLLPGGREHVARIELAAGPAEPGELSDAIPHRRTNRSDYRPEEPVAGDLLAELDAEVSDLPGVSVRWLTGGAALATFREETVLSAEALVADEEMSRDSHAWFRHSWAELQEEASGPTYDGSIGQPTAILAKTAPDLGESAANDAFLASTRTQLDTAPVAGIVVADRSLAVDETAAREAWLQGGRLWQRLHLAATARDVAMHPMSTLTELTDRERALGADPRFGDVLDDLVGDPDLVPVMTFRAGFATRDAYATPRRPLAEVVDYVG